MSLTLLERRLALEDVAESVSASVRVERVDARARANVAAVFRSTRAVAPADANRAARREIGTRPTWLASMHPNASRSDASADSSAFELCEVDERGDDAAPAFGRRGSARVTRSAKRSCLSVVSASSVNPAEAPKSFAVRVWIDAAGGSTPAGDARSFATTTPKGSRRAAAGARQRADEIVARRVGVGARPQQRVVALGRGSTRARENHRRARGGERPRERRGERNRGGASDALLRGEEEARELERADERVEAEPPAGVRRGAEERAQGLELEEFGRDERGGTRAGRAEVARGAPRVEDVDEGAESLAGDAGDAGDAVAAVKMRGDEAAGELRVDVVVERAEVCEGENDRVDRNAAVRRGVVVERGAMALPEKRRGGPARGRSGRSATPGGGCVTALTPCLFFADANVACASGETSAPPLGCEGRGGGRREASARGRGGKAARDVAPEKNDGGFGIGESASHRALGEAPIARTSCAPSGRTPRPPCL